MKTLAELQQIREETYKRICMRHQDAVVATVVVGNPEGDDACAKAVMLKFVEELHAKNMYNVTVSQVGCDAENQPVVTVTVKGGEKAVYGNVKPEMVAQIIDEHIAGGKPVAQYMI